MLESSPASPWAPVHWCSRLRSESSDGNKAPLSPAGLSLAVFGMLLAATAFAVQISALLLPVAVILGSAYGVILVAGLRQIETLGHSKDRARLNAAYFSFTYISSSSHSYSPSSRPPRPARSSSQ